jgi:hypothetical protein
MVKNPTKMGFFASNAEQFNDSELREKAQLQGRSVSCDDEYA